jgi:prepilin-type N-terminal cleavage/methylation domain-containing protein
LRKGFTLVELVTAIGVLAILATIAFTALNPIEQFKKAQDSKRKSDLSQIQKALEGYYQDYHRYPPASANKIAPGNVAINWGQSWQPYIDVLPIDPKTAKNYAYWVDEPSIGQSYRLYASLDRTNDIYACTGGVGGACPNLPPGVTCGGICNYGISSPNVSP